MHIHEDMLLLMTRERIREAERRAEVSRALRLARPARRPARIRLGMALVRLGQWIMGRPSTTQGTRIEPWQAHS
jgi:hypothetical protein